jgi:hypothetical protein
MTTDEKFELILKPLMQFVNSTYEFQIFLSRLVIQASPYLSDLQKTDLASKIESLSTLHKLLTHRLDTVLPS